MKPHSALEKVRDLQRLQIESLHLANRLRDFLSICADILHWRATNRARDSAQALQACAVCVDGARHQSVPIHARTGGEKDDLRST